MLEEQRIRKFFTAEPDRMVERVRSFAERNGGRPGSGFRTLAVFTFPPESDHDRRFLQVAVRDREDDRDGPIRGNLTLRLRDESNGRFHDLARELLNSIAEHHTLHDHPRGATRGDS